MFRVVWTGYNSNRTQTTSKERGSMGVYKYFISGAGELSDGRQYVFNLDVTRNLKIEGIEDIREMEKDLLPILKRNHSNINTVIITNFKLF